MGNVHGSRIALPRNRWALFGGLTALLALIGLPVLATLFRFALHDETFSHMLLIPAISLYFFWRKRREISHNAGNARWPGGIMLLLGGAGYVVVAILNPMMAESDGLSVRMALLWTAWIGAFLLAFGASGARRALFALGISLFMIPIPAAALNLIIETLRHGSALSVSALFSMLGVSYIREGATVFHLGTVSIDIAPECSGIRSSIALAITALIAGQLFLTRFRHKAILVGASIILMMLKNGIRIVTLTLLAEHVDSAWLTHSALHSRGGIVFFGIAVLLLLAVLALLKHLDAPARQAASA
jgi:exosortase